jgi:hypothetical protein
MLPKVFNPVDDSVHNAEGTDDRNLLIGKVSDHLINFDSVQIEKTYHKFAFGVIELFLDFVHPFLRTQSVP